ncbi:MAG: cadherin domain-containing protein [Gammaproteobacteria bacterium]|nr:cadherin domain-containing protein [Gammaproteobacteria bacterium]
MNRKNLSIVASVFSMFVLTLWLTQDHDEAAQTASSSSEAKLVATNAKPSANPSATSGKSGNGTSSTRQHDRYATQGALTAQATSVATPPARNGANNDPSSYNSSPLQSSLQAKARVEPTPLEPRADPYALKANSGSVNVRFSVRLIGDADASTRVYLRQDGANGVIALNDRGADGDIVAGDNIHGGNIVLDTSRLQPDTCLSYIAALRDGESETVSSPLSLCISNLPVRTAASNTDNPVVFADGSKAVADEILVTALPGTKIAAIQALAASINATIVGSIPPLNLYQLKLAAPASEAQLVALVAQLNTQPEVKATSVNAVGSYASTPNDTEYGNQHGLQRVRAQDVWDNGATGNGVIVTVLDSGLDRSHPDFGVPGNCQLATDATPGVANTDCGGTNNDSLGHGTQVAGVIAAKTNNALGVAGVAHGSRIHSIQVSATAPSLVEMMQGFTDAAAYGVASVINASFAVLVSPSTNVSGLCNRINTAVLNGTNAVAVVVNAAGNSSTNDYYYPGRCNVNDLANHIGQHEMLTRKDLFITVANSASVADAACGSVGIDQRCSTSNYGAWVDIAAPGTQIRTTAIGAPQPPAGNYASPSGTSFSAPMVSGAAAILKQCGVPLDQIESKLMTGTIPSIPIVSVPFPDGSSAPRLDIYRVLAHLNRAPTSVNLTNNSLNDGTDTTTGVEVGTLTSADLDTCDKHSYTINGGADAAKFSIGGAASDRLILTDGVLNYTNQSSYTVIVHVTDFFGATHDQALTVNVAAVNHAPTISSQTFRTNEDTANSTTVGTVLASDPDSGNVLTYSITAGNTSSAFSINANTGVLSVSNSTALVYATNPTFSLTVTVTDGGGLSANATVTVNVNKAPTLSNQTFSVNESGASGTVVGTVQASDAGDTLSYSITASSPSTAFSINSSTGVVSVSNSAALVYATNPTFSLTVQVTDTGGLTASATVTVNVNPPGTPTNNAPVIANQTFVVADSAANDTAVGSVVASDPDAGDSLSFSITAGNTDSAFAINPATGVLSVSNSAAVSYTTNPTFGLTVRVTDGGGLTAAATVTVNVNAPTSPPPASGGGSPSGGGGGCSVMPVGADPDLSLILAVLGLLAYGLRRQGTIAYKSILAVAISKVTGKPV